MTKKKSRKNSLKRDLRREIFHVLESRPNQALNYKQVASSLGVNDSRLRILIHEILKQESETGRLLQTERGKFKWKEQQMQTVEGIIQITRHGRGFVVVDGLDQDIELARRKTGTAFWGDRVEVSYNPRASKPTGKLIRVVERSRRQFVGVIEMNREYAFCIPSDQKIHVDFFIPTDKLNGAKNGDKVIFELADWNRPADNPVGRVTRVLGKPGENDVEMHAIMVEFGLPYDFPEEVEYAAAQIPVEIPEAEIARRRDMRDTLTFTIDPVDAKDFDDALSIKTLENGNLEIGVHIADVSHYVVPGSIIDDEAVNRATSVYLVDRTIPMLPEVLSNNLCSLRPNEDKLTFSAVFEMNDMAEVVNEWFGRTVIHSDRRFTYEEAQERIERGKGDLHEEINQLQRLAVQLRERRFAHGGIDFRTEEVRFELDDAGKPLGVYVKEMKDSNKLIEDFMLLANTRVASFAGKVQSGVPRTFVYRIHDNPDPEKLKTLAQFVRHFGIKMDKPNATNAAHVLRKLLKDIEGTEFFDIVQQMAIRSMAKAEYSTENIGHFGLAFEHYSHFTSPIRRYPDVMVHRLLQRYLDGGTSADARQYEKLCKHSSVMEKKAQDAEWASIKYKQVEFMHEHLGEHFKGVVSGLTSWGMYVELLDSKCEGMVRLESIQSDFYSFDEKRYVLKGNRYGEEFRMGDEVEIRVVAADMWKRQLDFELVE
ncbi:MAG: ribonuclease R [Flavobacteriales bacterium]|nr:ribonuclease R [Flavobacteriales bacterium]